MTTLKTTKTTALGALMLAMSASAGAAVDVGDFRVLNVLLNADKTAQAFNFDIDDWNPAWTVADIQSINFRFAFTDDSEPATDPDDAVNQLLEYASIGAGGLTIKSTFEVDSDAYQVVAGANLTALATVLVNNGGSMGAAVTRVGGDFNFDSARLTVTAVPEPETYAMLLAGLGLVGLMAAKRRKAA